jgi:alpha/beta hydrolase family protein DUF900
MAQVGELSVRMQPAGGEVAPAVKVLPGSVSPNGQRQIVLLIHGYANDQPTASNSYQACIDHLNALPPAASTDLPSPIFKFYWPGDTRIRLFSTLSYPWEISYAVDSGQRLAEFLVNLAGPGSTPVQVHIVAHSLGNRVSLEMLQAFDATKCNVVFASFSLMAAAVPIKRVQDPAQLLKAAHRPARTQALFSTSDLVLHLAFPLGETVAGDGFFPQAVGRFGNPSGTWSRTQQMSGYGHSDYWPGTSAVPDAPVLARFLEVPAPPVAAVNVIPERQVAAPRTLPSATLPPRSLPVRALPGSP